MSGSSYVQSYSGFVGVDFTSDPAIVARNRLAHSVNMWRDYDSENGAAIETFPGFRSVVGLDSKVGKILKVYCYKPKNDSYYIIHATHGIFAVHYMNVYMSMQNDELLEISENSEFRVDSGDVTYDRSTGFFQNNKLYIICSAGYFCIYSDTEGIAMKRVDTAHRQISGEWIINKSPSIHKKSIEQNINFVSNGQQFKKILITVGGYQNDNEFYIIQYQANNGNAITVYQVGGVSEFGWIEGEEYRTIWFEPNTEINNQLYDFIKENSVPNGGQEETVDSYIPTTYYNGKPYEQRNMLVNQMRQIECGGNFVETKDPQNREYVHIPMMERLEELNIKVTADGSELFWWNTSSEVENGIELFKSDVYNTDTKEWKKITIEYFSASPISFGTIEEGKYRSAASLEYGGTSVDAILGCTKAAVYDGRVFLTGNPALPNTVFYSARNSTGANDPTYFGVYNYFNDGYGNTPNVDMLSTPSMLMVIKRDTVQDGSIYYHQGVDNTDEDSKNLIPRIYPSTSGAAGIGSVGTLESRGVLSCNFLDDMVLLTRRGLDGVSKETVNLERTIGHRSTCVDKLLLREDLSAASMTEWKGYLVICCNGHIYLADSRSRTQHQDGSYQYEWFYLEGLVTRGNSQTFKYSHPATDEIPEGFEVSDNVGAVEDGDVITEEIGDKLIYYVLENDQKYLVVPQGWKPSNNKIRDVLAVGDLLFLISDKNVCIVNTDMERDEYGRLTAAAYSFDGCGYVSGCATRLDDCGRVTTRKNTIFGMVVARFKTMIGSRCSVKSSTDGRSFDKLCDVDNNRNDWGDLDYGNATYDIDADHVAVIPERSRGWVRKQYYFYSDGYCQPFGLYEMSYHYNTVGRIRR